LARDHDASLPWGPRRPSGEAGALNQVNGIVNLTEDWLGDGSNPDDSLSTEPFRALIPLASAGRAAVERRDVS